MTYGWPSTVKPTWQRKPSSRMAYTAALSYTPRCGRRRTVVRAVGGKASIVFLLYQWGDRETGTDPRPEGTRHAAQRQGLGTLWSVPVVKSSASPWRRCLRSAWLP